jgi:hypothetical protein
MVWGLEAKMARRKTDIIQFKVRMLEELRKRLEVSAKTERRSLNAEIVARLEQSYGTERLSPLWQMAQAWSKLAAQYDKEKAESGPIDMAQWLRDSLRRDSSPLADQEPELPIQQPRERHRGQP